MHDGLHALHYKFDANANVTMERTDVNRVLAQHGDGVMSSQERRVLRMTIMNAGESCHLAQTGFQQVSALGQ